MRASTPRPRIDAPIDPDDPAEGPLASRSGISSPLPAPCPIDARIVIMDEPTAALSHKEIEDLFRIIERLKKQGKAILFISHKFEEIYRDRRPLSRCSATARSIGAGPARRDRPGRDRAHDGRPLRRARLSQESMWPSASTVLKVSGLSHPTEFDDISFELRRGEILGLYGLVGAGRTEVMQALFGITQPSAGSVALDGKPIAIRSPADAIAAGIVYVPEERGKQGVVLQMPIFQNISLPSLGKTTASRLPAPGGGIRARPRAMPSGSTCAPPRSPGPVGTLSGGNQQKVVIGKWLATSAEGHHSGRADQGHRHRLQGRRARLHGRTRRARACRVIMVSSELPEILGMSDRVARHARGPHRGGSATRGARRRNAGARRHRQHVIGGINGRP